jgi:hypothetical protein
MTRQSRNQNRNLRDFGWFFGAVTTTRFLIAPGATLSLSPGRLAIFRLGLAALPQREIGACPFPSQNVPYPPGAWEKMPEWQFSPRFSGKKRHFFPTICINSRTPGGVASREL